jgi:hypothetical protein
LSGELVVRFGEAEIFFLPFKLGQTKSSYTGFWTRVRKFHKLSVIQAGGIGVAQLHVSFRQPVKGGPQLSGARELEEETLIFGNSRIPLLLRVVEVGETELALLVACGLGKRARRRGGRAGSGSRGCWSWSRNRLRSGRLKSGRHVELSTQISAKIWGIFRSRRARSRIERWFLG